MNSIIRTRRKLLGLTQLQLAELCSVSRQCISDIELGRYLATPQMAGHLKSHLEYPALSDYSQVLTQRQIEQLAHLRPFELPPVNREPWQRMHRVHGKLLSWIGLPEDVQQWIEDHLSCDSGSEGVGIFSTAGAGAVGAWASPSQCGYRFHCVLDSLGVPLGERLLPCLFWEHPEFKCLYWPQAHLMNAYGTYWPDGLLLVRNVWGRFWQALEQEGPMHDATPRRKWDIEREGRMGLGCIRIPTSAVLALRMPEILVEEFRKLGQPGRLLTPPQSVARPQRWAPPRLSAG